jgi:hypothetical protein
MVAMIRILIAARESKQQTRLSGTADSGALNRWLGSAAGETCARPVTQWLSSWVAVPNVPLTN